MKLNLGCGDRYVSGWVNVDLPGMPHPVDQSVDLTGELPWPESSIECVYAGHVLEHLHLDDAYGLVARLLPLMVKTGAIMLVGPDIVKAHEIFPGDDISDEFGVTLNMLRHGADRWGGDAHHWECTSLILQDMLMSAGWANIAPMNMDEVALFWPVADARPKWQCAVGALALHKEK